MNAVIATVCISDDRISRRRGFLYVILSAENNALYVGQTRGSQGALGRLTQHLANHPPGTFRERLKEIKCTTVIGQVQFATVELSPNPEFHTDARDYREAVEALCQYKLIENITLAKKPIGVISRVSFNGYTRQDFVANEAERVVGLFSKWLELVK